MPIVFYKRWPNFLIKKNFKGERGKIIPASAGNRTPINCLEGNYANHYTTDADGWSGENLVRASKDNF